MRSDRKQKGEIGHDERWKGVMEDEEEWWEIKRSDERQKEVVKQEKKVFVFCFVSIVLIGFGILLNEN